MKSKLDSRSAESVALFSKIYNMTHLIGTRHRNLINIGERREVLSTRLSGRFGKAFWFLVSIRHPEVAWGPHGTYH